MSFSIGGARGAMGPGNALEQFGEHKVDRAFDPRLARRMLSYMRPYRARVASAFVLVVISSALTLTVPYLLKQAIDGPIAHGDTAGLALLTALLALCFLAIYASTAIMQYQLSWVGQKFLAALRAELFRHLQALPLAYHDNHIAGVTISRVIGDVAVINDLLSQGIITLAGDGLVLLGTITVMLSLSPQLALATFLVLPAMVLATWLFARQAQVAFRETRARIASVVGGLAENISGMRVIQAFAQEDATQEHFDEINRANRDTLVSAMALSFVYLPSVEFLSVVATGIVLWVGGQAVIAGTISLGVVVAFLAYVSRFFQPIQELSQLYTTMQAAMAGGENVFAILDTVPSVRDAPGAPPMPPIRGQVELRGVTFAYGANEPVLHDLNLVVEPGETVALVGPTGAGKSSIANLIARLYDPTAGAVLIDGVDVRAVAQRTLRAQSGIVPQEPFLFSGTIADNLRFGRPDATREQMESAARLANAHDFIGSLPDGYDTVIQEGGVNLSVGQRQLICIARAALVDPRILIMDEATSSVDTLTEMLIQSALQKLLAGRTAFVIAHRLSTIRSADLICVIDGGRIVERGRHADLLAKGGLYRQLVERQFVAQPAA